jgi:hypothetical protein
VTRVAHGADWLRWSSICRPVRARVAGTVKIRSRSFLGSHRRASWSWNASSPTKQFAAPTDPSARDTVGVEPVQGQVPQTAVFSVAERGDPVPVDIDQPQLRTGVRAFLSGRSPASQPASL